MGLIDADALSGQLNDRIICCNKGSIVEACLLSVLDMINSMPAVSPPPNDPLTLEQLREMVGNPVYVERHDGGPSRWAIVGDFESLYGIYFSTAQGGLRLPYDFSGKTWLAYRRKPEEASISSDEGPEPQRDNEPWKDFLSHRFERKE